MAEITLTKDNFEEEVLKSDKPVLVDFWAVWCGPCQMLGPTIEELAEEYEGKVKVGKVNVDEQPELAAEDVVGAEETPTERQQEREQFLQVRHGSVLPLSAGMP